MFVYLSRHLHVGERALQGEKVYAHGCACLCLQDQLVGDGALVRLVRITLAVVDTGLHHPLLVEGRETSCFVE